MALLDLACPACDYTRPDKFFHRRPTPEEMPACPACGHRLVVWITSTGVPLTKTYAEDRPYTDLHIRPDGKPQVITSWAQRRALMRRYHLEDGGARRGEKGCWA